MGLGSQNGVEMEFFFSSFARGVRTLRSNDLAPFAPPGQLHFNYLNNYLARVGTVSGA